MKKAVFCTIFFLAWNLAYSQNFSEEEKVQGYALRGTDTWFVFDADLYGVAPAKVVVTGSFRGWDQSMDHPDWQLSPHQGQLWVLQLTNPEYAKVPPAAEFKFRVDNGKWLDPPAATTNEKGGNLVFMQDIVPASLKAEIRSSGNIWATIDGLARPLDPSAFKITDAQGKQIAVAAVLPNTARETLIVPAEKLNPKRVYFLEIPAAKLKSFCSYDGWFRELYSHKPLGANVSEDKSQTAFRIFSPRAEKVVLYLYKGREDAEAYQKIEMLQDEDGVWEHIAKENLHGVYYDFTVHGPKEPGNHFFEEVPVHISDPYARVSDDTWGKCRVWEKTKPASPLAKGIPPMQDVIAYEVHIQDFTDLLPVPENQKGTFPAMVTPGLRNTKGQPIGFDYLLDLGINTVHLMPVQEFLHWPDDDWQASFKDDPFMQEQGIALENYQWGYRTSHCFAIESRFRKKGTEPGAEREQFRDLVQAFHDKGIAVIIDIVPNHTAENMDGQPMFFHFNVLDKIYYYRTKDLEHIGEYGNEVKTENRPMVQRWLIDQCKQLIEEFGIDGYRIDLAGQIDQQTLIKLKEELGPDIIVYGEPWIASNDPEFEANPDWDWYKADSPITFFQDDARNAFKGPVFDIADPKRDRGFPGGNTEERSNVVKGLSNSFPEDLTPLSGINYLDIHDNWALADQFGGDDFDGRTGVEEDRYKMAAVLLYTSLGPIVTHGGSEMMRSKAHAPLKEIVMETEKGVKVYMHGKRDTYNMRTANQFIWENVGKTKRDKGSACDYKGMYAFWKALNHFRLSEKGKIFRQAQAVDEGYYQFFLPENEYLLGYVVAGKVAVVMNTSTEAITFPGFALPAGKWKLIGNNDGFDHQRGVKDSKPFSSITAGKSLDLDLPPTSFKVWMLE